MNKQETTVAFDGHLSIHGYLNAALYKDMGDNELVRFLEIDASQLAKKFVSEKWEDNVTIKSSYTVVDSYYNRVCAVEATLTYNHLAGARLIKKSVEIA